MKTTSQRTKEEALDYRYFPEPDLPPIELTDEQIEKIGQQIVRLPAQIREDLAKAGVDKDSVETLLEYPVLIDRLYKEIENGAGEVDIKRISNWFANEIIKLIDNEEDNEQVFATIGNLTKLSQMVENGKLNSTAAKTIIIETFRDFVDPEVTAEKLNLVQESDSGAIAEVVKAVLAANPQAADDVKNGEMKAIGFLVGQVMKESKGQANPQIATAEIKKQLGA